MKQLIVLLLVLFPLSIFAQKQGQPLLDSLQKELPKLKDDTNKVKSLYNISLNYKGINEENGISYGEQGIELATKLNWKKGIALCNFIVGLHYQNKNDLMHALEYYKKASKIAEEGQLVQFKGVYLGYIGEVYYDLYYDNSGEFVSDIMQKAGKSTYLKNSVDNLNKAIIACQDANDDESILEFAPYLAKVYAQTGKFRDAYDVINQYNTIKDSLYSIEKMREMYNDMQLKIKAEKKIMTQDDKIKMQEMHIKMDHMDLDMKRMQFSFFIIGFILLGALVFIIFRSLKIQKKSNRLLTIEKQRSDDLLLNILPSEVAEELKNKGSADAKYFDDVTVLFTDFVGFTLVAEKMSPQELVTELDTCFKAFDDIIGKYNIEKIKTVGDAYLAVSGLPLPDPKHASNVVHAALAMRQFMQERKSELGDKTFDIRIGVHTGNVVAGIVGLKKFAYDIWGDTVNTAARMEQNSQTGKINISQTTYELVKQEFDCIYRGDIQAKNKGALSMFFCEEAFSL